MKKEYDLKTLKKRKVPAVSAQSKVPVTMRLEIELVQWATIEGEKLGLGYQTFISMKLHELMNQPSTEERLIAIEKKLKGA